MNIMHFSDERIAQIRAGSPLTPEEREFLVTDPPRFEECQPEREPELRAERDAQRVALREIRDTDCGCDDDYGPCPSCIARAALAEGAEPLSSAEVATVARTAAIAARALTEGADGPREVSGWAIEGSWSPTNRPEYWVGSSVWSTDPYRALRFVAARDARQAAELMLDGINTRICEHSWSERPSCRHCGGVGYTQLDTAPGTTSCRYCEERPSGGEGT